MKSSLIGRLRRRIRPDRVLSEERSLLPVPLSLPADSDRQREPAHNLHERAFYDGSVMIW